MAGLREKIKIGGKLVETTAEEKARLMGRAPPTTQAGAQLIGATPDQAKMVGTPAQKTNALRVAIQEGADLATAERREGPRRTQTQAEQSRAEQARELEQLSSLDTRVQELVDKQLQEGLSADADIQLTASGAELDTAQLELLDRIRTNPNDFEAIVEFNASVGNTQADSRYSPSDILKYYGGSDADMVAASQIDAMGQALATSVGDNLAAGNLSFEEMGFAGGSQDVADLLDVPLEQLSNLNITQLIDAVNNKISEEYNQVENLQNVANDPSTGAAERAAARAQLKELGAVGVRNIESDIDNLADDIATAENVTFLDEEVNVEELLGDEYLSGVVKAYFEGSEEYKKQIEEQEPQLAEFINKHQNILKEAASEIEEGLGNFAELQEENKKIADTGVGRLSDEIMEQWYPEQWGELNAESLEKPPVLQIFDNPNYSTQEKQAVFGNMEWINKNAPDDFIDEIKLMSPEELSRIGFTDQNSDAWKNVQSIVNISNKLKTINAQDGDKVAQMIGAGSHQELVDLYNESARQANTGLFESDSFNNFKHTVLGGDLAVHPEKIVESMRNLYLDETGNLKYNLSQLADQTDFSAKSLRDDISTDNKLYNQIKVAFNNQDNHIDANEFNIITNDIDNMQDLQHLEQNLPYLASKWEGNPATLKSTLRNRTKELIKNDVNTQFINNSKHAEMIDPDSTSVLLQSERYRDNDAPEIIAGANRLINYYNQQIGFAGGDNSVTGGVYKEIRDRIINDIAQFENKRNKHLGIMTEAEKEAERKRIAEAERPGPQAPERADFGVPEAIQRGIRSIGKVF